MKQYNLEFALYISSGTWKKNLKDMGKYIGKDMSKDIGKDIGKYMGKDMGKDIAKDMGRDMGKENSELPTTLYKLCDLEMTYM